jgi:hypothetical protein
MGRKGTPSIWRVFLIFCFLSVCLLFMYLFGLFIRFRLKATYFLFTKNVGKETGRQSHPLMLHFALVHLTHETR